MYREVKLTGAIGKIVAAVEFSRFNGQCVIAFTDGMFSTLGVEPGYDRGDNSIMSDPLDVFDFGDVELVRSGIVTAEELSDMRHVRDAHERIEQQAQQDASDRKEFERLKRKFGAAGKDV
jgi:hypothetical protein